MHGYVEGYWRLADQACADAETADLDSIVSGSGRAPCS